LVMCEGTVESLAPGGDSSDEDDEDDVLWRVRYDDGGDVEDYDLGDMTKKAISGPVTAAAQIYIVGGAGAQ